MKLGKYSCPMVFILMYNSLFPVTRKHEEKMARKCGYHAGEGVKSDSDSQDNCLVYGDRQD